MGREASRIDVMPSRVIPTASSRAAITYGCAAGLALVILVGYALCDMCSDMSLVTLQAHREELSAFTAAHYTLVVSAFMTLYAVQAALALPGRLVFTFAAGYLFGSLWGAVYINVAATVGATVAFLLVRHLCREWVEARIGAWAAGWQRRLTGDAFASLVLLRLIPAVPFSVINLVSGLSHVGLGTFVRATAIGMLPAAFIFTYAGQQLGAVSSLEEVASPQVLAALGGLAAFAMAALIYRHASGGGGTHSGETTPRHARSA